jgi:hypothetical protein
MQLEDEVLAQVHLPSSGIKTIEDRLPMPQIFFGDSNAKRETYSDTVYFVYTANIFLWKRINQSNNDLYGQDCYLNSLDDICLMLRNHEMTLDVWRDRLPATLRWCDGDPPSSNILVARLQAKYFEARFAMDLHFLDYALHIMPYIQNGHSVRDVVSNMCGKPRGEADIRILEAIKMMRDEEVWAGRQRCIDAAVQSNIVFDGTPGRLVVPSMSGTAHT